MEKDEERREDKDELRGEKCREVGGGRNREKED